MIFIFFLVKEEVQKHRKQNPKTKKARNLHSGLLLGSQKVYCFVFDEVGGVDTIAD
jgi:hypothetical protein